MNIPVIFSCKYYLQIDSYSHRKIKLEQKFKTSVKEKDTLMFYKVLNKTH